MDQLSFISNTLSIVSFIGAIWTYWAARQKRQEFEESIREIHQIVSNALWETERLSGDADVQLRRSVGNMETLKSIRTLTTEKLKYYRAATPQEGQGLLIEKGEVFSKRSISQIETANTIAAVWLSTPDFAPDSLNKETGLMVKKNLSRGVAYVYFYPANLQHFDTERAHLLTNIGASEPNSDLNKLVSLIPLEEDVYKNLLSRNHNTILFFSDRNYELCPECFEEIRLTSPERGVFWQKHDKCTTLSTYDLLKQAYESFQPKHGTEQRRLALPEANIRPSISEEKAQEAIIEMRP